MPKYLTQPNLDGRHCTAQEWVTFFYITVVPATQQPGKGMSPVHPQTLGRHCPWTLKGELAGPNTMAGRDIVAAEPDPAAAADPAAADESEEEEEEDEEEEEEDPASAGMLLLCQALCTMHCGHCLRALSVRRCLHRCLHKCQDCTLLWAAFNV